MIHTPCFFCGKLHIDYYARRVCSLEELAKKTSFEVLILILKDMKKFMKDNCDDTTMMASTSCFCKYSIQLALEEANGKQNSYTDLHEIAFGATIKLIKHVASVEEISEFIEKMCRKLWIEHEKLLVRVNLEQNRKFKHE